MEQKMIFDYPFKKKDLKLLNIKSARDLNGFYLYDSGTIYINLASNEVKYMKAEWSKVRWFGTCVTHETLHHEIYMVTNTDANDTEERLVQLMTGETAW